MTNLFGTPDEMVAMFRRETDIRVVDLIKEYPAVGFKFFEDRLLAGGLLPGELRGRVGRHVPPRWNEREPLEHVEGECEECGLKLSHALVPTSATAKSILSEVGKGGLFRAGHLCGWCAGLDALPMAAAVAAIETEKLHRAARKNI